MPHVEWSWASRKQTARAGGVSWRCRGDGGQAVMAMAVVMAVVVVLGLLVAHMGAAAADRAAARTAADASALAAVVGGAQAAAEASRRNGAILEAVTFDEQGAEVTVRVGRASASSRARAGSLTGTPTAVTTVETTRAVMGGDVMGGFVPSCPGPCTSFPTLTW